MRLVKYFQSLQFTILLCILSMITQGYHSYYTFHKTSNIDGFMGIIQSLLFVIVFEFFTMYYLVRGRKFMAGFFSVCYLIMNLFYYYSTFEQGGATYWTALFLSFIIPFSIYNIAENIPIEMEAIEKGKQVIDMEPLINSLLAPIKKDIEDLRFKSEWTKEVDVNQPIRTRKIKEENENDQAS